MDALIASYDSQKKTFDVKVAAVNAKGGATPPEYQRLKQEQNDLNALASQINADGKDLNNLVDTINSMVTVLNQARQIAQSTDR